MNQILIYNLYHTIRKMQPPETSQSQLKDALVQEYTNQLSDLQKKTMNIAQEHLGLSFNIVKSVGFQEYLSQKSKKK
jgi:hypothetical protein